MKTPIRIVSVMEARTVTGPAKNVLRFAQRARPDVDLSFLTFVRGQGSNQFIDTVRESGIEVDVVNERSALDLRIVGGIKDVLRRRQPDIVQTHAVKGHFLLRFTGLHHERPWIAFHHGYTAENLKMRLYNQLNRLSVPAADRVITVCRPFIDVLARQGVNPGKIQVLPNSIDAGEPPDAKQVEALRQQLGVSQGERILLSVGRFSSEKGYGDLVAAVRQLSAAVPGTPFRHVLVGDGLERQNIERAAESADVRNRFIFTGHQRDVRPYYGLADIFVLPSHSEGSPNVLLEAMAFGIPAIATSVGGVPDTIRHEESGLMVPPRDPGALSKAMARLLQDPDLGRRLATAASAEIAARFTPEAYCRSMCEVYERMLS